MVLKVKNTEAQTLAEEACRGGTCRGDSVRETHELTYVIGHTSTSLHLRKFATSRFVCRILAVYTDITC